MDAAALTALMAQDGPVVQCVLLKADGTKAAVKVDMTPKANAIVGVIGGVATVVGALPSTYFVFRT